MNTFLIVITWLTIIAAKVFVDWSIIERDKKKIRHGLEIVIVAIVAVLHQALSGVNKIEEWELAGWLLLFQTASYFFFFDFSLNLMRGKELFYYGKTAWTDKMFHKIGGDGPYLMSKIFALVLMIVAIVQLIKY